MDTRLKRAILKGALAGLAAAATVAFASTFNLFAPATGFLIGNANTYVTTAATITDFDTALSPTGLVLGGATGGAQGTGTINATALYINGAPVGTSTGAVSSVGLSAPSVFGVTGSPVTSAGTLGLTFATGQTANSFLATPNGTTGALGLRTIVAADLPGSITSNTSGNAATATALAAVPTQCTGSNFATGIAASGNANCSAVAAAGSNTQVQYNNSGVRAGASGLTYNNTTGTVFVGGAGSGVPLNITAVGGAGGYLASTANTNGAATLDLQNSSTGTAANGYIRFLNSADNFIVGLTGTAFNTNIFTNGPAGEQVFFGTGAAIPITMATNGSERIRVTSVGDVVINAPSSGLSLSVSNAAANSGAIAAFDSTNGAGSYITISQSGTTDTFFGNGSTLSPSAGLNDSVLRAQNNLYITAGGASARMSVSSNGNVVVNAPGSGTAFASTATAGFQALHLVGGANSYTQELDASGTASQSFGLIIRAGTNPADIALNIQDAGAATSFFNIDGTGRATFTGSSNGSVLVVNAAPSGTSDNAIFNGPVGGNTMNINGSATTGSSFGLIINAGTNTSDRALLVRNQAGTSFLQVRGDGETILTPPANVNAMVINATSTASSSFGPLIHAGTNSSDYGFLVTDGANTTIYFKIFGDGGAVVGNPTGGDKGVGTLNAQTLYVNGTAVTGGSGATFTVKTSNLNRTSTTPSADPDLSLSVISGHTYAIQLYLSVGNLANNDGLQVTLSNTGGGTSGVLTAFYANSSSQMLAKDVTIGTNTTLSSINSGQVTGVTLTGEYVATASGTLQLLWAPASSGSGTGLQIGSWMSGQLIN